MTGKASGPNADLTAKCSSHDHHKRQFDWIVHFETLLLIACDED